MPKISELKEMDGQLWARLDTSETEDMVFVPRDLLAIVLETAEGDSFSTESEFAWKNEHHESYQNEREKIRQLRTMAGIISEDVVGQGFFGIALAIGEKK